MAKEDNSLKAEFVYSLTSLLMAEIHRLEKQVEQLKEYHDTLQARFLKLNEEYTKLKAAQGG